MTLPILLTLFIAMPMLELILLLQVGEALGAGRTFALVILTGIVGAILARHEGVRVVTAIQREMAEGHMPAPRLLDGLMILIAGALLITPGLITDAVGFLLLIPPARSAIRGWLRRRFENRMRQQTVDVTYWEW